MAWVKTSERLPDKKPLNLKIKTTKGESTAFWVRNFKGEFVWLTPLDDEIIEWYDNQI